MDLILSITILNFKISHIRDFIANLVLLFFYFHWKSPKTTVTGKKIGYLKKDLGKKLTMRLILRFKSYFDRI